jgi:type IV secretion system protein VirD4
MVITALGLIYYIFNSGSSKDKLATSKLGTSKELKGLTGIDGLVISKTVQLNKKACYEGICVIGPTGAGKTTSQFYPNLLSNDLPMSSIVVNDQKGELYSITAKYQGSIGRKPILFSPLETKACYNPLEQCKGTEEVIELGQNILLNGALSLEVKTGKSAGGLEWIQMATPLFIAALLYCKSLKRPYNTIDNALKLIIDNDQDQLDYIFTNAPVDAREQYKIFKTCLESPRTMSSIKITLTTNLELFTDPNIKRTISKSDFIAEELRKQPTCLYITYPERKANYLSPFTSCFYSQFIDKIIDSYTDDSLPVFFLWDEFAHSGQLSNFAQNVASVRSRRMSFTVCLQSITQLVQLYGRANAEAILNNLKTKIILPGLTDHTTLDMMSNLAGYGEITVSSESRSEKGVSHSFSKTRRKVMEPDEIRRLKDDELLIIAHNRQPVVDKQNIYYKQERYLKNIL